MSSVGPVSSLTLRHFVEQLLVIFQWPLCRLGHWQVCSAECEGAGGAAKGWRCLPVSLCVHLLGTAIDAAPPSHALDSGTSRGSRIGRRRG